jgi:hypothetical protein
VKITVNKYEFRAEFERIRPDKFTYDGICALFEYLQKYEDSTGEELELDVIGLCCEFSEYGSAVEASTIYDDAPEVEDSLDEDENEEEMLSWLGKQTTVIKISGGGVIIRNSQSQVY